MFNQKKYSRREFLGNTTKGSLLLFGYSMTKNLFANITENSKVVIIKHNGATSIERVNNKKVYKVNQEAAQLMVDEGISRLTGIKDHGEAWKSIFPGINQSKMIGIKVNCIARGGGPYVTSNKIGLSTNPEVAYSIANSLTQMQVDGKSFPAENIIIWDRADIELQNSNYIINKSNVGVKCYGTIENVIYGTKTGYAAEAFKINGRSQYLSKILVEQINYLINLSVLKNHSFGGVTLSLKNHYGAINNPDCGEMHNNNCNPAVAMLNSLTPIREKQVICICDAAFGVVTTGPEGPPQVQPNQILFSTDSVALDTIGKTVLQQFGTTAYSLNMAKYIDTAANAPYNLGVNDLQKIDRLEVDISPSSVLDNNQNMQQPTEFQFMQNYPNPFNAQTTLTYQLYKPGTVAINIYNGTGALVRELVNTSHQNGYFRVIWDGKDDRGASLPSGIYLAQFKCDHQNRTIKMHLIK
jgi:hypothetical protein